MSDSSKEQNITPFQPNKKTLCFLLLEGGILDVL